MEDLHFHELKKGGFPEDDKKEFLDAIEGILQVPEEDLHVLVCEVELRKKISSRLNVLRRRLCGGYTPETSEVFNKTRIQNRAQTGNSLRDSQDSLPKMRAELFRNFLWKLYKNSTTR